MKRAAFVAIALSILCVLVWRTPSARVAFSRQVWSPGPFSYDTPSVDLAGKVGRAPEVSALAARFPDDVWWQYQSVLSPPVEFDDEGNAIAFASTPKQETMNALCDRFPRAPWLRVEQIGALIQRAGSERRPEPTPIPTALPNAATPPVSVAPGFPGGGPPSGVRSAPHSAVGPQPTPKPDERLLATYREGVTISDAGAKAEPNNSLWTWTRAYFLLQLHRDDEAFATLQRGARLPVFSAHVLEEHRDERTARERLRLLDWSEKMEMLWRGGEWSYRCSSIIPLVVERGERLERAGRTREALALYEAVTRLLHTRRLGSVRPYEISTAMRDETRLWGGNGRNETAKARNGALGLPVGSPTSTLLRSRAGFVTVASLLAEVARREGRADFATYVLNEDAQAWRARGQSRRSFFNNAALSENDYYGLGALWWLGVGVAWAMVLSVLLWAWCVVTCALMSAVAWVGRRRGRVAAAPGRAPGIGSWLLTFVAPILGIGGLLLYASHQKPEEWAAFTQNGYGEDSHAGARTLLSLAIAIGPILLASIVAICNAKRSKIGRSATRNQKNQQRANRDAEQIVPWLPLSPRGMRWLCAPLNWLLTWGTPLSWLALVVVGDTSAIAVPLVASPVTSDTASVGAPSWTLSLLLTFGLFARWAYRFALRQWLRKRDLLPQTPLANAPSLSEPSVSERSLLEAATPELSPVKMSRVKRSWAESIGALLVSGRDAFGAAALAAALIWVALLWSSAPKRATASAQMDTVLRVGEIAALAKK